MRDSAGRCAAVGRSLPSRGRGRREKLHRHARGHADRRRENLAADRCLAAADVRQSAAWPANVPIVPGQLQGEVELGDQGTQTVLVHVATLGSYNLLVGRDNALFAPLQTRFWYGLAAAIAVLSIAGLADRPHHPPRADVAGPQHSSDRIGHHSRRSEAPPADASERRRAQHAVAHHQRHARADRAAGARRAQCVQFHRARSAHAAGRTALAARRAGAHPAVARGDLCGNRRRRRGRRPRDPHIRCAAAPRGNRRRHAPFRLRAARHRRPCGECGRVLRARRGAEEHRPRRSIRTARCRCPAIPCCSRRR